MPYLKKEDRKIFINTLSKLGSIFDTVRTNQRLTAGTLNFLFTKISHLYISTMGQNYQHYNDIIGALEGAKLELYRRKVAIYENLKEDVNGDV